MAIKVLGVYDLCDVSAEEAESLNRAELDRLAEDFFDATQTQLAKMDGKERKAVIASFHNTAESLRTET